MHGIPRAPGRRAYSSVGREVGAVCVERLAVFVPSLPYPLLSTVYQCDGCLSYLGRGGSWLGCQVWPAIIAVSILELVVNSGSSRMSLAPNLHSLRATKLFIKVLELYSALSFFLYSVGVEWLFCKRPSNETDDNDVSKLISFYQHPKGKLQKKVKRLCIP